MLDFRIDTFLMVCETLNYTRAAEKLHITQPAVSQHIRFLEKYYQAKLVEQEGKKLRLTEAGEILFQAVRTMSNDENYLKSKMQVCTAVPQKLRIGATLTVGEFTLANSLGIYFTQNPALSAHIQISNTQELLDELNSGEIDCAIVEGSFAKKDYDYTPFSKQNYIAVCGIKYPLPTATMHLEELLDSRLIIREPGSGTREILERVLESHNLDFEDFRDSIEVNNLGLIKSLVKENCGISFLYEAAVFEELKSGSIRKIELKDFKMVHDFTFIWSKDSIYKKKYLELLNTLRIKNS